MTQEHPCDWYICVTAKPFGPLSTTDLMRIHGVIGDVEPLFHVGHTHVNVSISTREINLCLRHQDRVIRCKSRDSCVAVITDQLLRFRPSVDCAQILCVQVKLNKTSYLVTEMFQ